MNHWSWVCLESGTRFPWITPHILKKRFIFLSGFPIASGLLHSKHEGSQTSYFNLSNEWGSLPFPHWHFDWLACAGNVWILGSLCHKNSTPFIPVLSRGMACEYGQDLGNSAASTLCKVAVTLYQEATEKIKTSYIHHRPPSKTYVHLPGWRAEMWSDIHAWSGTGEDRCSWLFWQCTVDWTHNDIMEAHFQGVRKRHWLSRKCWKISAMSQNSRSFFIDQMEMHFALMEKKKGELMNCSSSYELCDKIPIWRTSTHCKKHLEMHVY